MFYKIKPWIPTIIFIFAFAVSISVNTCEKLQYESWTTTTGILTSARQDTIKGKKIRMHQYILHYDYIVDGKEYSGVSTYVGTMNRKDYVDGNTYEIWYNPNNPKFSHFHNPLEKSSAYFPFVIASVYVFYEMFMFFIRKKRRKKK